MRKLATIGLVFGLAFGALPSTAEAQTACTVTATMMTTTMGYGTKVRQVVHFTGLTMTKAIICVLNSSMSAQCNLPSSFFAGMNSAMFSLVATRTMTPSPTCMWQCGLGAGGNMLSPPALCSITASTANQLPVELMEFSVERTESAEGESEQPEADESG